jgi:hypothetical protein
MEYPLNKFQYIANFIIDNLEGGYYHPDFYIKGATMSNGKKISAQAFINADYGRSGETLFGLDRHAGWNMWYSSTRKTDNVQDNLKYIYSGVYQYANDDAKKFWETLDKLDARNKFFYGSFGGNNRKFLQDLCVKMMYKYFLKNVWSKLDEKGKQLVINDNKLALNYVYSAWNGIVYSNYYNNIFNQEIKKGVTDTTEINKKIINARATSKSGLVRDSATKLTKLFPKIKQDITEVIKEVVKKKRSLIISTPIVIGLFIGFLFFRKK